LKNFTYFVLSADILPKVTMKANNNKSWLKNIANFHHQQIPKSNKHSLDKKNASLILVLSTKQNFIYISYHEMPTVLNYESKVIISHSKKLVMLQLPQECCNQECWKVPNFNTGQLCGRYCLTALQDQTFIAHSIDYM